METSTISTPCYCSHTGVIVVTSSKHGYRRCTSVTAMASATATASTSPTSTSAPTAPALTLVSGFPLSAVGITRITRLKPRRPFPTICGVLVPDDGRREELGERNFCGGKCEMRISKNIGDGKLRGFDASSSRVQKSLRVSVRCNKMFVPGFGEKSPEAKAADNLHNFFTFIAVKIVLSQTQHYNREGYEDLMDFVDRVSLKDGDKFCAALMRESFRHKKLALRIMEVRSAYSGMDFEWDNVKKLCNKHMEEANTRLMREFLVETSEFKD